MSSVQPSNQPVVYDTGSGLGLLKLLDPTLSLNLALAQQLGAAQARRTADVVIRSILSIAGILIAVSAIGMIASEQGPGLIAETVKGVIEGGK